MNIQMKTINPFGCYNLKSSQDRIARQEKIAEAVEKNAPKTPEERREDLIEEATEIDMEGGILSETMEIEEQTQIAGMEDMNDMFFNSVPEEYSPIDYRI